MEKLTHLTPTNLVVVEVPADAENFELNVYGDRLLYSSEEEQEQGAPFPEGIWLKKTSDNKNQYELLGLITNNAILFDVEPFLEPVIQPNEPVYYKYFGNPQRGAVATTHKEAAFRSLLALHDIRFYSDEAKLNQLAPELMISGQLVVMRMITLREQAIAALPVSLPWFMDNKTPDQILSYIADQALGRYGDGTVADIPYARAGIERIFGEKVVELAIQLYPLKK